nr:hypothetical protein [Tanacetum cinerariifolium]
MCRVLGYQPSLGTFRRFYVNSISNGWLSFLRSSPTPCYLSKKFDSLKNWNDHFFWINASICPISVSWHTSVSIVKDPLPSDNHVNIELLNLLDHHRTIIRRYPETFLFLVGSFEDLHVRPTLLRDDESAEIIQIVEHTIVDELREHVGKKKRKVAFDTLPPKKLKADGGVVTSEPVTTTGGKSTAALRRLEHQSCDNRGLSRLKLRADGVVISEPVPTSGGKSPGALRRLELQSELQGVGSSSVLHPTKEFVSSSVTPILKPDVPEDYGSTQDAVVETHHTFTRIVVSSSSDHGDVGASPRTEPHVEVENIVADSARGVGTDSVPRNNIEASTFRNTKIIDLNAKLEKVEKESVEVVGLCGRVSELETGLAAKSEEIADLNGRNSKLLGKEKSAELDACIADVRRDMDNDLYPRMFTAMAEQRWVLSHGVRLAVMKYAQSAEFRSALGKVISVAINKGIQEVLEVGIEHEKSGWSLTQVEAYDLEVKNEFVAVMTDFENVSLALLDELESLKDSPLASIMSALVLKDDQGPPDCFPGDAEMHY